MLDRTQRARPPIAARSALAGLIAAVLVAGCGPVAGPTSQPSTAVTRTTVAPSAPAPASPPPASPMPSASPTPAPTPSGPPAPPEPADLDGLLVAPELAHRLPLAVMIDDARAARPQSGFNAASIVYQATADGFETRYMLVFQERDSPDVGPVRSARFFLAQWASEIRAAIGHYGGDRRTRRHIRANPRMFTDVDGITRGNPAYHRTRSRPAPHNAYGSTASIRRVALVLGAPAVMSARLHRRPFLDPAPLVERAASQRIGIPYRTNIITYRFDRASDSYLRSVDGRAQIDPADGKRVTATNVIVLFQKFRIDRRIEPGHSRPDITTLGSGKALVFREGRVIKARWRKSGDTGPTIIQTLDGHEISLVRGRIFIQVVPIGTRIAVGS